LSVAGDAAARGFVFAGFVSSKAQERATEIARWRDARESVVIFEAPHRIEALAAALAGTLAPESPAPAGPPRRITVCRELTKQFEEVATMPVAELPGWLAADANHRRGEFVLVLHAAPASPAAGEDEALPAAAEHALRVLLRELPLKQAAAIAAELTGLPRKRLYGRALEWREGEPADES
jgi:16S rRNA (cytidine1402-2'-O)-methyltransferase